MKLRRCIVVLVHAIKTFLILLIFNVFVVPTVQSEYLIVKKNTKGFMGLDNTDAINFKKIHELMLQYQWPNVLAQNTISSDHDLFKPEEAAEENFIRTLIKQQVGKEYDLVFIPTVLYELFVLQEFFDADISDTIGKRALKIIDEVSKEKELGSDDKLILKRLFDDTILKKLNNKKNKDSVRDFIDDSMKSLKNFFKNKYAKIREVVHDETDFLLDIMQPVNSIHEAYNQVHKSFVVPGQEETDDHRFDHTIMKIAQNPTKDLTSIARAYARINKNESLIEAHFKINNSLLEYCKKLVPDLLNGATVADLHAMLNVHSPLIVATIIRSLPEKFTKYRKQEQQKFTQQWLVEKMLLGGDLYEPNRHYGLLYPLDFTKLKDELSHDKNLKPESVIAKTINLEYRARKLNRGIMLRGSTTIKQHLGGSPGLDPEVLIDSVLRAHGKEPSSLREFLDSYGQQKFLQRSLSFGNSLFAGSLNDNNATSYYYMTQQGKEVVGYALLIDKKAYKINYLNNLFFIAPFNNLVALFAQGEFFHSRSKASVKKLTFKEERMPIDGIELPLIDVIGFLLIERDPLEQAALISEYIGKNFVLMGTGAEGSFQQIAERLSKTHEKAYQFYTVVNLLAKPMLKRLEKKAEEQELVLMPNALENRAEKFVFWPLLMRDITLYEMHDNPYQRENDYYAGNFLEHALWTEQVLATWFYTNVFWVEGINTKREQQLLALAGILQVLGNVGTHIFKVPQKKPHAALIAFKYLSGDKDYKLANKKQEIFNMDGLFKELGVTPEERKTIVILAGMVGAFENLFDIQALDKDTLNSYVAAKKAVSPSKEQKKLIKQVHKYFEQFIKGLYQFAAFADYESKDLLPLLTMSIALGAASIMGLQPITQPKTMLFSEPLVIPKKHVTTKNKYEELLLDKYGKIIREDLINYFIEYNKSITKK
jgi:hypothetical protein